MASFVEPYYIYLQEHIIYLEVCISSDFLIKLNTFLSASCTNSKSLKCSGTKAKAVNILL